MNYVTLVENGGYKKEDLRPEDRAFVNGMEYVMNDVLQRGKDSVIDFHEIDDPRNNMPTLSKLMCEIECDTLKMIEHSIRVELCTYIVHTLDSYASEE